MIRSFLLTIRKLGARLNDKQKIMIGVLILLLWAVGAVIDKILPFAFWYNSIRAIISLGTSLLTFSELYLYSIDRKNAKMQNEESYIPVRKRFSYKERKNISILLWVLLFIALLLSSRQTLAYTFLNSWVLVGVYSILTFVRANRDEYLKSQYGIPDSRDVDFDKAVKNNIEKRHKKWAIEDKKKEEKRNNKKF